MEKTYIVADRPKQVVDYPEARIFNAPRPLYGSIAWQGDFIHGVFYAANPEGYKDAPLTFNQVFVENDRLAATELVYLTREEFDARVDTWAGPYAEKYKLDLTQFDRIEIVESFVNQQAERYIIPGGY